MKEEPTPTEHLRALVTMLAGMLRMAPEPLRRDLCALALELAVAPPSELEQAMRASFGPTDRRAIESITRTLKKPTE